VTTTTSGAAAVSSTVPAGSGITHVAASDDELEALLITDPPTGYVQQDDSVGDTGPSDLKKAVHDDGGDDAKKALIAEGFVRGYQRLWQTASGDDQVVVFIYQYATVAGAKAGYTRGAGLVAGSGGVKPFTPAGLPAGASTGVSGTQQGVTIAIADVAVGVYLVQVDVNGSADETTTQAMASAVAVDQLGRL
jgi:hypothetical protein